MPDMPDMPEPLLNSLPAPSVADAETNIEGAARQVVNSEPLLDEVCRLLARLDEPRLRRFIATAQRHLSHNNDTPRVCEVCKEDTSSKWFGTDSQSDHDIHHDIHVPTRRAAPSQQQLQQPLDSSAPTHMIPAATASRLVDLPRGLPRTVMALGTRSGTTLLTSREQDVLRLAGQGYSNQEVANILSVSYGTVSFHLQNVFNKTGAHSRTKAYHLAKSSGWLAGEDNV